MGKLGLIGRLGLSTAILAAPLMNGCGVGVYSKDQRAGYVLNQTLDAFGNIIAAQEGRPQTNVNVNNQQPTQNPGDNRKAPDNGVEAFGEEIRNKGIAIYQWIDSPPENGMLDPQDHFIKREVFSPYMNVAIAYKSAMGEFNYFMVKDSTGKPISRSDKEIFAPQGAKELEMITSPTSIKQIMEKVGPEEKVGIKSYTIQAHGNMGRVVWEKVFYVDYNK